MELNVEEGFIFTGKCGRLDKPTEEVLRVMSKTDNQRQRQEDPLN